MNGFADLTKMETNRNCLRRIARHDEPQFSKDSIVNVMEKFVKTVNVMDDTILVPCRLMDRQVGDSTDILSPLTTREQGAVNISAENIIQQNIAGGCVGGGGGGGSGSSSCGQCRNSDSPTIMNYLTAASSACNNTHTKNVHEFLNSSELFNLYNILNAVKKDLLWAGKDDNNQLYESDSTTMYCETTTTTTTANDDCSDCNDHHNDAANDKTDHIAISNIISASISANESKPTHNRRPSNTSVVSVTSVSQFSDSESVISNENDSGIESEGAKRCDGGGGGGDGGSSGGVDETLTIKKKANSSANTDKATELAKRCRRHLNGLYQCLEQMTEAANYLTARYQNDIGGGSV